MRSSYRPASSLRCRTTVICRCSCSAACPSAARRGTATAAAAKLAAAMVGAGYLVKAATGDAARTRPLRLAARGRRLLATVEQIYAELEAHWAEAIGDQTLQRLRRDLTRAV